MKLGVLMVVNAVVTVVFGIAFVFVPAQLLSLYGVTADAPFSFVAQLFGAALLALAVVSWWARNAGDSEARRAIILGFFVGDAVGFVTALIAQLGGVVNALGWSTVAIYLLLALGFGYFQFVRTASP